VWLVSKVDAINGVPKEANEKSLIPEAFARNSARRVIGKSHMRHTSTLEPQICLRSSLLYYRALNCSTYAAKSTRFRAKRFLREPNFIEDLWLPAPPLVAATMNPIAACRAILRAVQRLAL